MSKYRTLESVTFVKDGKVVSVKANRTVELDDEQAAPLGGKLVLLETQDSMFPDGTPQIPVHINRADPVVIHTVTEAPKPVRKSGNK